MTITLARLETETARTVQGGARPSRRPEFAAVMAAMREQGRDPVTTALTLVLGPFMRPGDDGRPLERFIFRVEGGSPLIEIEVELLPGLIAEHEWRAVRASIWRRTRDL